MTDDFYEDCGIVYSRPRISLDCDNKKLGTMTGDIYYVVDVHCPDGTLRLFTTDELRVINEAMVSKS